MEHIGEHGIRQLEGKVEKLLLTLNARIVVAGKRQKYGIVLYLIVRYMNTVRIKVRHKDSISQLCDFRGMLKITQ